MPLSRLRRQKRRGSSSRRRIKAKPIHRLGEMDLSGLPFDPQVDAEVAPIDMADDLATPDEYLIDNREIDHFVSGDLDLVGSDLREATTSPSEGAATTAVTAEDLALPAKPPPPPPMDLDIDLAPIDDET